MEAHTRIFRGDAIDFLKCNLYTYLFTQVHLSVHEALPDVFSVTWLSAGSGPFEVRLKPC